MGVNQMSGESDSKWIASHLLRNIWLIPERNGMLSNVIAIGLSAFRIRNFLMQW